MKVRAMLQSINEPREVEIINDDFGYEGNQRKYLVKTTDGVVCEAIFNCFTGLYYADDVYTVYSRERQAELLPAGWIWKDYTDRSGHLEDPKHNSIVSYDFQTGEVNFYNTGWELTHLSMTDFKHFAEKWVKDNFFDNFSNKQKYVVRVTETLVRDIEIDAANEEEAIEMARNKVDTGELDLNDSLYAREYDYEIHYKE